MTAPAHASWWWRPIGKDTEGGDRLVLCGRLGVPAAVSWDMVADRIGTLQHQHGLPTTGVVDEATSLAVGEPSGGLPVPDWWDGVPLSDGDAGFGVRMLQQLLGVEEDAVFGTSTEAAVRRLQGQYGIPVTGVAGRAELTYAFLR